MQEHKHYPQQHSKNPWYRLMQARDREEVHRAATPLELLFDLVFVVAIAVAGQQLHHAMIENHFWHVLPTYLIVFFAIWWAWMNFTWFASAYDTDDVPYRLMTFVQMVGSLIIAAGIPSVFQNNDFSIMVIGYVVMRFGMVGQWLRASKSDVLRKKTDFRYAMGIILVQIGWVLAAFTSWIPFSYFTIIFLIICELLVPVYAERTGVTSWHPEHIAERYGLLTIIVLGESILGGFNAMNEAIKNEALSTNLIFLMLGSVIIMFAMWWTYFDRKAHVLLNSSIRAFVWGYGHYFIFASIAAVGAALAAAVDICTGHAHISSTFGAYLVAVPLVIYSLVLWVLHDLPFLHGMQRWLYPITAGIILLVPLTDNIAHSIFIIGIVYSLRLIIAKTVIERPCEKTQPEYEL